MEKNSQKQGIWQDEKRSYLVLRRTSKWNTVNNVPCFDIPPPPWSFWRKLTLVAANTRNHQTPKIHFPYFSAPGKPATPIGMAARVIEPGPFTVQASVLSSPTPWAGRSYGRRIWFPAVVEKDEKVHLLMAFGVVFDYVVQQSVGTRFAHPRVGSMRNRKSQTTSPTRTWRIPASGSRPLPSGFAHDRFSL